MSTAAATTSDRAAQPESSRAWARASATLNPVACLAIFLFALIAHGRGLALTVRDEIWEPGFGMTGRSFGTSAIHIIMTCISRGMMRGVALYKVLWHRAICCLRAQLPGPRCGNSPSEQGAANACAGATATNDVSARLADAACHCTARAVLPGICRDFDAAAESAGTLRDGLLLVPTARLGGSLTQFIAEVDRRKAPASRIETPRFGAPPERRRLDCLLAEEQPCACAPPQQSSAECSSPEAEPCTAAGEPFERTETGPAMRCPVSSAREVATAPIS